jgi:hypothetical protein
MTNDAVPIGVVVLLAILGVRKYLAYFRMRASLSRGTQPGTQMHFDTTGWRLCDTSPSGSSWVTDEGDALSLYCGPGPGELSPSEELPAIRDYARKFAATSQGSLVWADRRTCGGIPGVAFIYKREQLPAYAYTGVIMIPNGDWHFVLVMASMERGVTGVRDAVVTASLLSRGQLNIAVKDARGRLAGWFRDPYDSALDADALASVADDEQYDESVPSHPLSKIRRFLRTFEETMRLDDTTASGEPSLA